MPALLRDLKKFYASHARTHLPWRTTRDPYRILVSEVMLQQTQVDRVVPYYTKFIKEFPTAKKLASAPLSRVLLAWQGLGYNRRAKYLHEAARILSSAKNLRSGEMNTTPTPPRRIFASPEAEFLESLPGVGPYTARAVAAFAFNTPEVFIETNIRTVLFHSQILKKTRIADKDLLPVVAELLKKSRMEPREFYAAMMDYGAHLKRQGVRLNHLSKHYAKQSKFEGSARQRRSAHLRKLLRAGASDAALLRALNK